MKNKPITIQSLRQSGYKVRVIHRYWEKADSEYVNTDRLADDGNPNVTQIEVTTPDGATTVAGFAYRAKGDQHHRKLGNLIALNRALSQL